MQHRLNSSTHYCRTLSPRIEFHDYENNTSKQSIHFTNKAAINVFLLHVLLMFEFALELDEPRRVGSFFWFRKLKKSEYNHLFEQIHECGEK